MKLSAEHTKTLGWLAAFLADVSTDHLLRSDLRDQLRCAAQLVRRIAKAAAVEPGLSVEEISSLSRLEGYADACWRASHPSGAPEPEWFPVAFRAIERLATTW